MKVGVRAYAKHRAEKKMQGGTAAAVRKALDRGQIQRDASGKIDIAAADAAWPADVAMGPELEGGTGGEPDSEISFSEARRRKEVALAQLRQLEVAEREGRLVAIDDVIAENAVVYSALRATLLAIPGKYSPAFVGLQDFGAARHALDEMVRSVMSEMVQWSDDHNHDEAA